LEHTHHISLRTNLKQHTGQHQELKRLEILVNKTREEIAKEYVTKLELKDDMSILMDRIDKIGEKLDKLFEVK
jgi:phage host-nuclease inhibitor protein Gam